MRDRRFLSLFEIPIPDVTIDQRHHEGCAQKNDGGADMISPIGVHAVNGESGIESEGETKELVKNAEPHPSAPFQNSPERERDKKSGAKNEHRDDRSLCLG